MVSLINDISIQSISGGAARAQVFYDFCMVRYPARFKADDRKWKDALLSVLTDKRSTFVRVRISENCGSEESFPFTSVPLLIHSKCISQVHERFQDRADPKAWRLADVQQDGQDKVQYSDN